MPCLQQLLDSLIEVRLLALRSDYVLRILSSKSTQVKVISLFYEKLFHAV